jgi:hypothetical protein
MEPGPGLPPAEYQRRKAFLDGLKTLTKAEFVEIVRILQKHTVAYSENLNGIFFNVCSVSQEVFDDLEQFLHFTQSNRRDLSDRDCLMSSLAVATVVSSQ